MIVIIHDGNRHAQLLGHGQPRQVTDMPVRQHVGRAEHVGNPVHKAVVAAPRAVPEDDGFRPVLRLDRVEFFGNGAQGLVPADSFPLALAAFAGPLHGVEQAVLVVLQVGNETSCLPAQVPLADGVIHIAPDLHGLAVFQRDEHAAAGMPAGAAIGVDDFRPGFLIVAINRRGCLHVHKSANYLASNPVY